MNHQLLGLWPVNVVGTALLVSALVSLGAAVAVRRWGALRQSIWRIFLPLFAFSLLGFVVGELTGNSREAAVGTVIPAVLTLIGGAAAYVVGSKGVRAQAAVSALLLCFTLSLLIGSVFGIRLRVEYDYALEDPGRLKARDLALEYNKFAVETERLENYIRFLKLQRDYSALEKLDLSRFETNLEKRPDEPRQPDGDSKQPGKPAGK